MHSKLWIGCWIKYNPNTLNEVMEMLEKNKKKLESKKLRNSWSCARPVTQIVPNKKKKSRQQLNKEARRRFEDYRSSNRYCCMKEMIA